MNDKILHIQKYLNNQLSDEERKKFEAELNDNKELRDQLNWHKIADHLLKNANNNDFSNQKSSKDDTLRKELMELGKGLIAEKEKKKIVPMYLLRAAAALILILGGIWIWKNANVSPMEKLFAQYEHRPNISTTLGTNEEKSWLDAQKSFERNEFKGLIVKLNALLDNPDFKQKDQALLMRGYLNLKEGQTKEAIQDFKNIGDSNIECKELSEWYLALAYLKAENIAEAKSILEKICQDTTHAAFNDNDPKMLLEKLKK